jgi:hypothetical protein
MASIRVWFPAQHNGWEFDFLISDCKSLKESPAHKVGNYVTTRYQAKPNFGIIVAIKGKKRRDFL